MSGVVSPARLRELLHYDPTTGKLWWKEREPNDFQPSATKSASSLCKWWNNRFADKEAFTSAGVENCRAGKIFGVNHYAHRIAWAIHYGSWPTDEIDHEDGDRANNRISNLRSANHALNMKNKRQYRNSRNVIPGLSKCPNGNWQAFIGGSGGRTHLGTFPCFGAAVMARSAAKRALGYHSNHGRAV